MIPPTAGEPRNRRKCLNDTLLHDLATFKAFTNGLAPVVLCLFLIEIIDEDLGSALTACLKIKALTPFLCYVNRAALFSIHLKIQSLHRVIINESFKNR